MSEISVFIVDDSAVMRQVLSGLLNESPSIHVLGSAPDPIFAEKRMEKQWPDVIVLDIEMPRMDGITFLRKLMVERPTPVVICSTLTEKGAQVTLKAMEAGAVEIITKPKIGLKGFLTESRTLLVDAIKGAAQAKLSKRFISKPRPEAKPKLSADAMIKLSHSQPFEKTTDLVVVIGTSTGGTQALEAVLTQLPRTCPGIVIVQHMPEQFTAAFAERLDSVCEMRVKEAQDNDRVIPGLALIAPGSKHMLLKRSGAQYRVEIKEGPLVSRHRPSVDVLFRSAAQAAGSNALGIIMTGMGDDGAAGLKEMRDAGAFTVAQDEASCVVFGMPKEAIKKGGAVEVKALNEMPELIQTFPQRHAKRSAA